MYINRDIQNLYIIDVANCDIQLYWICIKMHWKIVRVRSIGPHLAVGSRER